MKLSVILITKNEARNLRQCLHSVAFADQIVVVDSGSTDGTQAIARDAGALVIETADWPGFGAQKNRALDAATGDWIFSIDADERVTPELAAEIAAVLKTNTATAAATATASTAKPVADAYEIPRKSWYCGKFINHAGWSPDYVTRLARRDAVRFSDDLVHERLLVTGRTARLKTPLLHYSFRDFSQVLHKVDMYSTLSARQRHARGQRGSVGKAVLHGLALAISNGEGSYYRYLKLWLLAQPHQPDDE